MEIAGLVFVVKRENLEVFSPVFVSHPLLVPLKLNIIFSLSTQNLFVECAPVGSWQQPFTWAVRRLWVKWQDWTVGCFASYLSHWKPIRPSKIVCIIGAIPCLYCSWQVLKKFLLSYDTNAVWIDESLRVIYATVTLEHVRKLKQRSSFFIRFYKCLMLWSKKKNRLIKDSCY